MNDPIGTVRREDHDGDGYSIWALVANSVVLMTGPATPTLRPMWRCVHSTAPGNLGAQFSPAQVRDVIDSWRVIGAVPGTPAAEATELEQADSGRLVDEAVVERMARAMHAADVERGFMPRSRWEGIGDQQNEDYTVMARAALAALKGERQ